MTTHTPETLAQQALAFTRSMVERFGPRLAGSDACLQAADAIAEGMQQHCRQVQTEDFSVHPAAFLDWIRVLVVLYIVVLAALWMQLALLAFLMVAAGLLLMVFEFFLYGEVIDPLFPRKTGRNVWGVIEPAGEIRQQVIVSGHHDSARIFNFFIHQPRLYSLRVMGGIGTFVLIGLYSLGWSLVQGAFGGGGQLPLAVVIVNSIFTLLLLLVGQLWFFASAKGTPGAGDNMIATGIALAVGEALSVQAEAGSPLKHTRVHLVSFDAEEAGLRGARRFFQQHGQDLLELPTWHFNIDCPYTLDDLFFLTSDINGSVPLSTEMAERCVNLAHSMGYPAIHKPITFLTGGTDAAESAKVGVKAVTLMAMPWDNSERAAVYHTPDDLPEAIEPKAVEAAIAVALGFINEVEAQSTAHGSHP